MVQNYEFDACLAFLSLIAASYSSSSSFKGSNEPPRAEKYGLKLHGFHLKKCNLPV